MQTHSTFTILLAEDDADDRILFRDAISTLHVKIALIEAETGIETIDILQRSRELPDILVIDINMPLMSGIDCVKIIREDPRLTEIPVVIMSTSANQATIEEAKSAGADRYALKPSSFHDLTKIVRFICASNLKETSQADFVINSSIEMQQIPAAV